MHCFIQTFIQEVFYLLVHGSLWYVSVVSLWVGVMGRLAGKFLCLVYFFKIEVARF